MLDSTSLVPDDWSGLISRVAGEEGVSPGQACVFYDDGEEARVLGGGFIAAVEPASLAAILDHKPRAASGGAGARG